MEKNNSYRIPGPVVTTVLATLLTAAISFNAWAVAAVYSRPTRNTVKEMIVDKSPYTADRSMILQALEHIRGDIAELKDLLKDK
jgi:hypothetical protein